MKALLIDKAFVEVGTGLGLARFPSLIVPFLVGSPLDEPAGSSLSGSAAVPYSPWESFAGWVAESSRRVRERALFSRCCSMTQSWSRFS